MTAVIVSKAVVERSSLFIINHQDNDNVTYLLVLKSAFHSFFKDSFLVYFNFTNHFNLLPGC